MKNNLLLILFLFFIGSSYAKPKKTTSVKENADLNFIQNNKIKYEIDLVACDTCAPITNIGDRVFAKLTKNQRSIVKKIDKRLWISLLTNSKTDWASNLILYDIFDRNATVLSYSNKSRWRKYLKKEDIDYWKSNLNQIVVNR